MAVEKLAQVVFETERHRSRDHPAPIREQPAREHRPDDREREKEQRVAVVGASKRLVARGRGGALCDDVDRVACERRDQNRHHGRRRRERERDRDAAAVGPQEAK